VAKVRRSKSPSLRAVDVNWRLPYSGATPTWKEISDLARTLDHLERLRSNPLLSLAKGRKELLRVFIELHKALMLACHGYWLNSRQPRLFDRLRWVGLPSTKGAQLKARLWLESTAWEYNQWIRRIFKVFGGSMDDVDPNFWIASTAPPQGYWDMVEALLESIPVNGSGMGFVDERGVLLRWMRLHGHRPTESLLLEMWLCLRQKRSSVLMPYF